MEKTRSTLHRLVEEALEELRINFESEYAIDKYSLDLYLPEFHVGLEVDGPSHTMRRKKDAERDAYLRERYGLIIARLDFTKEKWPKSKVKEFIVSVIVSAYDDVDERRRLLHEHIA